MKQQLSILVGGLLASLVLPLQASAQDRPTPIAGPAPASWPSSAVSPDSPQAPVAPIPISAQAEYGPKAKWSTITEVKITNLEGQPLGRIQDLVIDLTNARIVEVLVVSDQILRLGGKTVEVAPGALIPDEANKIYKINMSAEAFKAAPKFDLSKWAASTQTDQVADAYQYFREEPYFLTPGETSRTTYSGEPAVNIGSLERMSKVINMPVDNVQGKTLGKLQTLVFNVPQGRITNAFLNTDNFGEPLKFSTAISPSLLSFNAKHNGLILDISKVEYKEEPQVIFQDGSAGQVVAVREETTPGPQIGGALVQGTNSRDINTTAQIYQSMQGNNLDSAGVEVATLGGRVTLRGDVSSQNLKDSINAIAVAVVKKANVDNQIVVKSSQAAL